MGNKKIKIIWDKENLNKLHTRCDEYFSDLDEKTVKNHFNIILNSNK